MFKVQFIRENKILYLTEYELTNMFPSLDLLLLRMEGLTRVSLKTQNGLVLIERSR